MKILRYLVLVGLSLIVACGQPPLTVTLTLSELNPAFGSSVTFTATATPVSKIVKLELLEGTIVKKTVDNTANLEQNVLMDKAGKRSFTARVTDSAGVVASSAVVEVSTKALTIPVVTLSASRNPVIIGGSSTLTASVVASSGVKEVEFFEGITPLGKDSSAPFELVVNDFTSVGSRDFKAVATDNNGLQGEGLVTVTVVDRIPTSFELKSNLLECFSKSSCLLRSPDIAKINADYGVNVNSQQTNWVILKDDGSPAPTDGSFGTFKALEGAPDGLLFPQIFYVPPNLPDFSQKLNIVIQATSVQDPTQQQSFQIRVTKKGTVEGIEIVASPSRTVKVNQSITLSANMIESIGFVGAFIEIQFGLLGDIGKLECVEDTFCTLIPGIGIVSTKFKVTGLKPGIIRFLVTSLDVKPDGSHPTDTFNLTVTP